MPLRPCGAHLEGQSGTNREGEGTMPGTDDWLGLQHRLHQLRRGEPTLGLIALEFWLRKGCRTPDFFSDCEKALVSQGRSRMPRRVPGGR